MPLVVPLAPKLVPSAGRYCRQQHQRRFGKDEPGLHNNGQQQQREVASITLLNSRLPHPAVSLCHPVTDMPVCPAPAHYTGGIDPIEAACCEQLYIHCISCHPVADSCVPCFNTVLQGVQTPLGLLAVRSITRRSQPPAWLRRSFVVHLLPAADWRPGPGESEV